MTTPPYKRDDLRAAWRAGRRAGRAQMQALDTGWGVYQAWRRGFNSIEVERQADRQREYDAAVQSTGGRLTTPMIAGE